MIPIHRMVEVSEITFTYIDRFQEVLVILIETIIWLMYYLSMIFITIDRLLAICLNLKYPVYCNVQKAKKLLFISCLISAVFFLVILLLRVLRISDYYPYIWYLYVAFDFMFVIIAMVTYTFIFQKYRKTRELPTHNTHRSESLFQVFKNSRFYLSVLLIASFLLLKVTADLVLFFVGVVHSKDTVLITTIVFIMWALSDSVDAWLYIFAQRTVRTIFCKKFYCCLIRSIEPERDCNQNRLQTLETRV